MLLLNYVNHVNCMARRSAPTITKTTTMRHFSLPAIAATNTLTANSSKTRMMFNAAASYNTAAKATASASDSAQAKGRKGGMYKKTTSSSSSSQSQSSSAKGANNVKAKELKTRKLITPLPSSPHNHNMAQKSQRGGTSASANHLFGEKENDTNSIVSFKDKIPSVRSAMKSRGIRSILDEGEETRGDFNNPVLLKRDWMYEKNATNRSAAEITEELEEEPVINPQFAFQNALKIGSSRDVFNTYKLVKLNAPPSHDPLKTFSYLQEEEFVEYLQRIKMGYFGFLRGYQSWRVAREIYQDLWALVNARDGQVKGRGANLPSLDEREVLIKAKALVIECGKYLVDEERHRVVRFALSTGGGMDEELASTFAKEGIKGGANWKKLKEKEGVLIAEGLTSLPTTPLHGRISAALVTLFQDQFEASGELYLSAVKRQEALVQQKKEGLESMEARDTLSLLKLANLRRLCVGGKKMEMAQAFFDAEIGALQTPKYIWWSILLRGYSQRGDVASARKYFNLLNTSHTSMHYRTAAYVDLIRTFAKKAGGGGMPGEAEEAFKKMRSEMVPASPGVFSALMECQIPRGDARLANNYFQKCMDIKAIRPSMAMYEALARVYLVAGEALLAWKTLDAGIKMYQKSGNAGLEVVNITGGLASALAADLGGKHVDYLRDMVRLAFIAPKLRGKIISRLMFAAMEGGDAKLTILLYQECFVKGGCASESMIPMISHYYAIKAYGAIGNVEKVKEIFAANIDSSFEREVEFYNGLLQALVLAGDKKGVEEVYEDYKKNKVPGNVATYEAFLTFASDEMKEELVKQMKEKFIVPLSEEKFPNVFKAISRYWPARFTI